MGASVISGVDASPVLEPTEHVFDLVTLAIENAVVPDRLFAVGSGRDAGRDAAFGESLAEPVGVIALIAEQLCCGRERVNHQGCTLVIAHLAFAEQHDDRKPLAIAYGMRFEFRLRLVRPIRRGNSPFFKRLAAVRCAFRCVASIISRDGLPALRAISVKILLKTPRRLQRTNRL
jgi:hypothetical protein